VETSPASSNIADGVRSDPNSDLPPVSSGDDDGSTPVVVIVPVDSGSPRGGRKPKKGVGKDFDIGLAGPLVWYDSELSAPDAMSARPANNGSDERAMGFLTPGASTGLETMIESRGGGWLADVAVGEWHVGRVLTGRHFRGVSGPRFPNGIRVGTNSLRLVLKEFVATTMPPTVGRQHGPPAMLAHSVTAASKWQASPSESSHLRGGATREADGRVAHASFAASIKERSAPSFVVLHAPDAPSESRSPELKQFADLSAAEGSASLALVATLWAVPVTSPSPARGRDPRGTGASDRLDRATSRSRWREFVIGLDGAMNESYRDVRDNLYGNGAGATDGQRPAASPDDELRWHGPIIPAAGAMP
jgi:hypothetical protein